VGGRRARGLRSRVAVRRFPLPEPTAAVAAALALLPPAPGVYRMRDAGGRVVYAGRSANLRARVRSYWRDLRDRPHLVGMLRRVAWLDPVLCDSEHDAALFERHLLTSRRPPYNRTKGVEQLVHLRLTEGREAPSLDPVVDPPAAVGSELFGPYLGWEPVRQAAAALNRLYPIRYTAEGLDPSRRELGRSRGVDGHDRHRLAAGIRAVLRRDPGAVAAAVARLAELRDRAADDLQFEAAAELQRQVQAVGWIAQARLRPAGSGDRDVWAVAGSGATAAIVTLEVRDGRLHERHLRCGAGLAAAVAGHYRRRPRPELVLAGAGLAGLTAPADAEDAAWLASAQVNADFAARLVVAGALSP
jgi:excinuclease ABC subunit C